MTKRTPFEQFCLHYQEAIDASGNPNRETIRKIVVDLVDNPNTVPENSEFWPIVMYIRSKLQDPEFPTNWLTGKALRTINIYRIVLENIERLEKINKLNFVSKVPISNEVRKLIQIKLLLLILEQMPSNLKIEDIEYVGIELLEVVSNIYHVNGLIKHKPTGLTSNPFCYKINIEPSN